MLTLLSTFLVVSFSSFAWGDQGQTFPAPTLVVTPSPFSSIQPRSKLPEEPDEFDAREVEAYYDWRNDMFFRKFDLTGKRHGGLYDGPANL